MDEEKKINSQFLKIAKETKVLLKKIRDLFCYLLKQEAIENNQLVRKLGAAKTPLIR